MSFVADTRCDCATREAVNFGDRGAHLDIDILLLHYTGMESAQAAINWLCIEESGVSCHYVVEEDGAIWQLVPEKFRAWHAGASKWQGEVDTNSRSIGIEIVNPGHGNGYPDFPEKQIDAVIELSKDIVARNHIPARNVLAHSDVAPGRKLDPGEKFPWQTLFENGLGLWVEEDVNTETFLKAGERSQAVAAAQSLLAAYGYGLDITGHNNEESVKHIEAFQRHFRPSIINGVLDKGTFSTLERLVAFL